MKKLTAIGAAITTLLTPMQVLADDGKVVISPPAGKGFASLSNFIQNALLLVFTVGAFIVLLMLIIGAYEWMTSGGDKEAVGKARTRIINALIGLVILAIAFALVNLIGVFTGLNLKDLTVPGPLKDDPGRL